MYCSSTKTGVYAIFCRVNGYTYIGSSSGRLGIRHRINKHRNDLQRGVHHSPILQKHFERYGEEAFAVMVLEECEPAQCIEAEQIWLNINGVGSTHKSYNICSVAGLAPSKKGKRVSESAKKKISEKNKRRTLSPEVVQRITEARIAVKALEFVVTPPGKEELKIKNLKAFCREHNLDATSMIFCAKGKHAYHKQWKCRYASSTKEEQEGRIQQIVSKKRHSYIVTSPTGEEYITDTLDDFCLLHGLQTPLMRHVANGNRRQHKGWLCRKVDESEIDKAKRLATATRARGESSKREYIITKPDGTEIFIRGLTGFCREHNLQASCLSNIATGKLCSYKGWKCRFASETSLEASRRLNGAQERGRKKRKTYIVTLLSGEEVTVPALKEFCLEHLLDYRTMSQVATGKRKHHRGYRCRYAD